MANHTDTVDIQLSLKSDVVETVKSKLYSSSDEAGIYILSPSYLPVAFRYQCRGYYLIVKLSHEFTAGIETAEELKEKVIQLVIDFFHISTFDIVKYKVVKTSKFKIRVRSSTGKVIERKIGGNKIHQDFVEINRIEYKNDYQLKVADEKFVAMDIFRISADNSKSLQKGEWKYSNRTNCTYESDKNNHVSITCYFKEYERLKDGDIKGSEKYKNILRTEVKVKNAHLNYQRRNNHRDKTLANYFKTDVAQEYFQNYIEPIFYTEPFYRLDIALNIISQYGEDDEDEEKNKKKEHLKNFQKARLSAFLTRINEVGITAVKAEHDVETFKNYIKKIRELGINPLCFSPIINGKPISIEKMENFTLFENAIEEDI